MTDISKALRELLLARAAGMIDAEEFERRQAALHAELLAERSAATRKARWPWALAIGIAAVSAGVYFWSSGSGSARNTLPPMMPITAPAPAGMPQSANTGGDLKAMSIRLAEKLARDPTNGEGWALLGQTYVELRQYKEADQAFAKADALGKVDARLREEWAKAKAAMAVSKPAP